MAKPVKGDVVVIPFPYSDLTAAKRRPALVVADLTGDDLILCMITSQQVRDSHAVTLAPSDFTDGGLPVEGNIRPSRIFTADVSIIDRIAGHVSGDKLSEAINEIIAILQQ